MTQNNHLPEKKQCQVQKNKHLCLEERMKGFKEIPIKQQK